MTPEEAIEAKERICVLKLSTTWEFDRASPRAVAAESNGIGPDRWPAALRAASTALLHHYALPALIHDWEYGRENDGTLERWHEANSRFLLNCLTCIKKEIGWWRPLRRQLAKATATALYDAVESAAGMKAWREAFARNKRKD